MDVKDRKEGFGYLIDWVIRFGDLLLINAFFLLAFTIFADNEVIAGQLHYREKVIAFLIINLCYFLTSSFIHLHTSSNIVFLEKIVQQSSAFIALYAVFVTTSLSLFKVLNVSILVWIVGFLALGALYVGWHILFRIMLKSYRRRGFNFRQVIIIGGDTNGKKTYEALVSSDFGYKVLGFFDNDESQKDSLPNYLGKTSDIEYFIEDNIVDDLFCAISGNEDETIFNLIKLSEKNMIRFHLIPEFHKYFKRRFSLHFVNYTPVLSLRYEPLQYFSNRFIKRTFDIVVSLAFLITLFPFIYVIFGILIKKESPGPIIFKQKRTGIKGKEFSCYKFRSMRQNREANKLQATKGDPRITKIGAFMRKTSIDELPQFINVLKNDMSIVGPRPHMLQHTALYSSLIDKFMVRHLVKPGITGWAQVTGCRGETKTVEEMEMRVIKDVWYLENWTFFLDLKIIFLTVYNAIKGEEKAF